MLTVLVALSAGAPVARADTTHPFLNYITVPGGGVQPEAVDRDGNLIAWMQSEEQVAKYDQMGNPVNFSGLGTNVIDGKGGQQCPTVPTDCDRVPTNGFLPQTGRSGSEVYRSVAVDDSVGPASGYIYVANDEGGVNGNGGGAGERGEVDVFNAAGRYVGTVDQKQTGPDNLGLEQSTIWVDRNGVLYIVHWDFHEFSHVDRYVPIDANPVHDQFSGQIRIEEGAYENVAAGPQYAYTLGFDKTHVKTSFPHVARYPMLEFHRSGFLNFSISDTFRPDNGPFGGSTFGVPSVIYVDPLDEHVYVGSGWGGFKEFDSENHQIGPMFAGEHCPGNGPYPPIPSCHIGGRQDVEAIAIDRSGDVNDGHIFIHGPNSNQIAVFGPPTTIPDIEDVEVDPSHTAAHLSATIGLANGPIVSECTVEYSTTIGSGGYEHSTPCTPAGPYATDMTATTDLIGLPVEAEYHYRFAVTNSNGTNTSNDRTFRTEAVLSVSTEAASDLTPVSANLNGSLNADSLPTTYRFEYGLTTQYSEKTPQMSAGSSSSVNPVPPVTLTGLEPGRTYHYRLVASNSMGKTRGQDLTFVAPDRPRVSGVHTVHLTETSGDLMAQVDSRTYDTTYHFEYGPTPAYGSISPDEQLTAGSGPQPVSYSLVGLPSGYTYHFRVVATNQWGTVRSPDSSFGFEPQNCPNTHVRQITRGTGLPDCRAYELVSPGNAGSVTLFPGEVIRLNGLITSVPFGEKNGETAPNTSGSATSPARFGYFGGEGGITGLHAPNFLFDRYVATRTDHGWVSTYPGRPANEAAFVMRPSCDLAMSKCIDYAPLEGLVSSIGTAKSNAPYVWDINGQSLGRWPTNLGAIPNGEDFIGATAPSPDFSHFMFSSRNVPFAPDGLDTSPGSVYDNDIGQSTVRLISRLPGGKAIPQGSQATEVIKIPKVSTDGSHVLMTTVAPNAQTHLYISANDAVTYDIGVGHLIDMTADGTKVAFLTPETLDQADTDESVDIYLWEEATGTSRVLSEGNGSGNLDSCSAAFTEGCGVTIVTTERPDIDNVMASESGDVYFYSPEQLDPDSPGVPNERNLYVYRKGHVQFVTTLDPGTQVDRMQVSPSGDHAAILSRTQATGYVNVSLDNGSNSDSGEQEAWEEMYTFEPASGEVLCASCSPSGVPPSVQSPDLGYPLAGTTNKDVKASQSGRFMANDGRVAFATADSLVPTDTNGKIDVYEFTEGRPQLITSGTSTQDTQGGNVFYPATHTGLEAFSEDGKDLYFSTFESFVPEDLNGNFVKFYDARGAGGFPNQSALLPCTAADECHGDGSVAPDELSVGTASAFGQGGNAAPIRHRHKHAARKSRRHKKRGRRPVSSSQSRRVVHRNG